MINIHVTVAVISLYLYTHGLDRITAVLAFSATLFGLMLSTAQVVLITRMYHSPTGMEGIPGIAALLVEWLCRQLPLVLSKILSPYRPWCCQPVLSSNPSLNF